MFAVYWAMICGVWRQGQIDFQEAIPLPKGSYCVLHPSGRAEVLSAEELEAQYVTKADRA